MPRIPQFSRAQGDFWGWMEMFLILIVGMASQVYVFVKRHQIVPFKCVPFIIYKLHLNKADYFFFEKERAAKGDLIVSS